MNLLFHILWTTLNYLSTCVNRIGSIVKRTTPTTMNALLLFHPGKQDVAPSRSRSPKTRLSDELCSGHHEPSLFPLFFSFFWTRFSIDWDEHRPICLDLFCHTSCITLCSHTATYGSMAGSCVNEEQVETNKGKLAVLSCDWCAWYKSCTAGIVEEMAWFIRSSICERLIIKLKVQVHFLMPTRLFVCSHDLKCLKLHLPSSEPPHVWSGWCKGYPLLVFKIQNGSWIAQDKNVD